MSLEESSLQLSLPISTLPYSLEAEEIYNPINVQEIKDDFPNLQPIKKIDSLNLFNFKSFAQEQYVGPFLDFTSIIGPNGTGKSNVVEAICFVLDISLKSLRSSNYKDLINKKALESLHPSKKPKNNANNFKTVTSVGIKFLLEDNSILEIKRTIDSSFESHYFIEEGECEHAYYNKFLLYNNILPQTHSFLIMQGETDNIISKSPSELTNYFEILSGSIQYKKAYEELKNKLETLHNEMRANTMNLNQLKSERRKLRQQKNYSEEYKLLMDEIDRLEMQIHGLNFLKLDLYIEETCREYKSKKEDLEKEKREQENERRNKQKKALEFRNKKSTLKKLEEDLSKKQQELLQTRNKLSQSLEEINYSKNLNDAREASLKKLTEELALQKNQLEKFCMQQESIKIEIAKYEKELANDASLSEPATKLKKNYNDFLLCQKEANIKLQPLRQEISKSRLHETNLKFKIDECKKNQASYEENCDQLKLKLSEIQTNIELKKCNIVKVNDLIHQLQNKFNTENDKQKQMEAEKEKIDQLRGRKEKLILEAEIYFNSLKEQSVNEELYFEFKSIKGFREDLASLLTPLRPEFDLPLRLALGPAMNYLVVDTNDDARQMNLILREKGYHKDVVILENISPKKINLNTAILGNYGTLAEYSISYRRDIPNLDKACSYFLAGKVFCDGLNKAERLRDLYMKEKGGVLPKQIITYDGVILKKGSVTAVNNIAKMKEGRKFARGVNSSDLESRKNKEKEIEKIKKEIISIDEEIKKMKSAGDKTEIKRLEVEIQENMAKKENLEIDLKNFENNKASMEKNFKNSNDSIRKIANETGKFQKQLDDLLKEIENLNSKMKKEEEEIFAPFCKKLKIANIDEFKTKDYNELEKIYEEKNQLIKKLENIEWQIKNDKTKEKEELILNLKMKMDAEIMHNDKTKESLKGFEETIDKTSKEILKVQGEVNNLKFEITKEETLESETFTFLKDLEFHVQSKEKELRELKSNIHNYLNKKIQFYEEIKIKSIVLPLLEEPSQYEYSFSQMEDIFFQDMDKTRSQQRMRIHLDYDQMSLQEILGELQPMDENELMDPKRIENKIEFLQNSFNEKQEKGEEYLSNITQLAGLTTNDAKLEKFEQKIKDIEKRQNQLLDEEKEINKNFEIKKNARLNLFNNYFEDIKKSIDEIYKKLTKSERNQGGSVLIYLDNQSEPFNGGIIYSPTPPDKRYIFDTEQLSGGEKTMGGLALLFAVNIVTKAKFMIFDETDAFLDFDNSQRYVDFLKDLSRSEKIQMIVVSHKQNVFESSDSLVGVTYVNKMETSEAFSLDLRV